MLTKRKLSLLCFIISIVLVISGCGKESVQTEGNTEVSKGVSEQPTGESDDNWPNRPITIIVGFDAGGGMDTMSRLLAPLMSEKLGVPVKVENRPGAGGGVGAEYFINQPADGYTLYATSSASSAFPALDNSDVTYNDVEMLAIPFRSAAAFQVSGDSEYEDMNDLIEAWKEGGTTASNTGIGGSWHIPQALAVAAVDGEVTYVPYPSGKDVAFAVVKGEVDWGTSDPLESVEFIKDGKSKALAVFLEEAYNLPGYGEIPPITDFIEGSKESVLAGAAWRGISAKAGSPEPIIEQLTEAIRYAMESDEVAEFVEKTGAVLGKMYGEEAQKTFEASTKTQSWLLYDLGLANRSPEDVGIPRP